MLSNIVDTDFVLASLLHYRDFVDTSEIRAFTKKIYKEFKNLYVDTCNNSILGAVQGSPDVFNKKGEVISKVQDGRGFFKKSFILTYLGSAIDMGVKKKIFELAKENLKEETR